MKTKAIFMTAGMVLFTLFSKGQNKDHANYIWSYEGKKKTTTIGVYSGLGYSYSEISGRNAGFLSARAGVVFNEKWAVGVGGSALNYDYALDELVTDGTYRLQAAYTGMFVEYIQPFGNWGKASISILSGQGLAFYEYNKDFREGKEWYEELIDVEEFAVFEPGVELGFRIMNNWWLTAQASYLTTSPVELLGQNKNFMENYTVGMGVKWGIY